jgi:gliding motility-associated-like protein
LHNFRAIKRRLRILLQIKKYIILGIILFASQLIISQPNSWTWMRGTGTVNTAGSYGTQGVPSPTNLPPATVDPARWVDLQGNFWMFGGNTMGSFSGQVSAALWKFDPATNIWTWVKGPNTLDVTGVYGIQGIPSPNNYPGARAYSPNTWIDSLGNLWMFGGTGYGSVVGYGYLNDLWKYNIATNEWTWMKGSNTMQANAIGGSGSTSVPAARDGSTCSWIDNDDNFWLYGGAGISGSSIGTMLMNDMWNFSPSTNNWSHISGSLTTIYDPPSFGAKGIPALTNYPGARRRSAAWTDLHGKFWMYSGETADTIDNYANYSDMWQFDPTTGIWTWVAGTNTPMDSLEKLNQLCTHETNKIPFPSKIGNCNWVDACGSLWGFGGVATDSLLPGGYFSHDLWNFNVDTKQFTWVNGSQPPNYQAPVYGTQGVSNSSNTPLGMIGGSSFISNSGELWMFGGFKNNNSERINDLWKYTIDPNCSTIGVDAFFTNLSDSACVSSILQFSTSNTLQGNNFHWDFGVTSVLSDTSNIPSTSFSYNAAGDYQVSLIISNSGYGCITSSSDTFTKTIHVFDMPIANAGTDTNICLGSSIQLNASGGIDYSWAPSTNLDNSFIASPIATITNNTQFILTVNNANCIDRDTIQINVDNVPIAIISGDTVVCSGQSVSLQTSSIGNLQWSTSSNANSITFNPISDTTITLIVSNSINLQCKDTSSISIDFIQTPTANAGIDTSICNGNSVQLNGTGVGTYSWSPSINLNNSSIPNPIASPSLTTNYILTVTNVSCIDKDTIVISVDDVPNASILGNTQLCSGQSTTLTAGTTGIYNWSNGSTNATITISPPISASYSVTITNPSNLNCFDTASIFINVTPMPVANAGPDTSICPNGKVQLFGSGGSTYAWSPSNSLNNSTIASPIASPTNSTIYVLTASNGNCADIDSVNVTIFPAPVATILPSVTVTIDDNSSISLIGSGGVNYLWSPNQNLTCISCTNPIATPSVTTIYCLTITDANTCTDQACVEVVVETNCGEVFVPDAFSPNGDGANETLKVYGKCIKECKFEVFDRWGEKIFETNDILVGWDGSYKGKLLNTGNYSFQLYAKLITNEEIKQKGIVLLVR